MQRLIANRMIGSFGRALTELLAIPETFPACMPDLANWRALLREIDAALAQPTAQKIWELFVRTHKEVICFYTDKRAPWTEVSGTCMPIEWFQMSLDLAANNADLQDAIRVLESQFIIFFQNVSAWLHFTLEYEEIFAAHDCAIEFFVEKDLKRGLKQIVLSKNDIVSTTTAKAKQGHTAALAYENIIGEAGALNAMHKATITAALASKEYLMLSSFEATTLSVFYDNEICAEMKARLAKAQALPADLVTCGLALYANSWQNNPLSDFETMLLFMKQSHLLKDVYATWIAASHNWAHCAMECLSPTSVPDTSPLTNLDIIKKSLSDATIVPIAELHKVDAITMVALMTSYRDFLATVNQERTLLTSTRDYFDLVVKLMLLYHSLTVEILAKLRMVSEDFAEHRVCLPVEALVYEPDHRKKIARARLFCEVSSRLRLFENPCEQFQGIFDMVRNEWNDNLVEERSPRPRSRSPSPRKRRGSAVS